jgi:cytochrome c biogenesis protein CcmG/thiol:disulfide interchange protein DsbE
VRKLTFVILVTLGLCRVAPARTAPRFRADLIDGQTISLTDYLKPKRLLLLSFWASWCTPCLEELKMLSAGLKTADLPLDVLTVNVDTSETRSDVKPAIAMNHLIFPVILDPKHEIFSAYRADKSLPYSVVIDGSGTIVETFNGYSESMISQLRAIKSNDG